MAVHRHVGGVAAAAGGEEYAHGGGSQRSDECCTHVNLLEQVRNTGIWVWRSAGGRASTGLHVTLARSPICPAPRGSTAAHAPRWSRCAHRYRPPTSASGRHRRWSLGPTTQPTPPWFPRTDASSDVPTGSRVHRPPPVPDPRGGSPTPWRRVHCSPTWSVSPSASAAPRRSSARSAIRLPRRSPGVWVGSLSTCHRR